MRLALAVVLTLASGMATAHSWYEDLVDPYGRVCCERRDCHPVAMCRTREGVPGVQIGQRCIEIPWNRVLTTPSPDGRAHACWYHIAGEPTPDIRCVILPGEV